MLRSPRRALARLSTSASNSMAHLEMGTVLDRYGPDRSWLKGWTSFSASTMAVVSLRKDVEGWGVPAFKQEAAKIYTDVGAALANADEKLLKKLTTPSCFATMKASLRERPNGQRHEWDVRSCIAKVVQVRIGHHASNPGRRFAQVTCEIEASLVWSIFDRKGAIVGGVGSKAQPFEEKGVWWVFERCISQPPEPPAWRLKEQIRAPPPAPE